MLSRAFRQYSDKGSELEGVKNPDASMSWTFQKNGTQPAYHGVDPFQAGVDRRKFLGERVHLLRKDAIVFEQYQVLEDSIGHYLKLGDLEGLSEIVGRTQSNRFYGGFY